MARKKKDPPKPGRLVDAWVGKKPQPSFKDWLRTFQRRYRLDPSDFRPYKTGRVEPVGRVDPVAAYRFQRLTSRDRIRFAEYFRELALLGYDLNTYEGIDKFWRLSPAERDRLSYVVQDPQRFREKVRADFFEAFRNQFDDFQARFNEFFKVFQETEPSFDPEDLAAHYRFMGLSPEASAETIRERYRALAQKYHPDHGGDEERMKALNIAYASLLRQAED